MPIQTKTVLVSKPAVVSTASLLVHAAEAEADPDLEAEDVNASTETSAFDDIPLLEDNEAEGEVLLTLIEAFVTLCPSASGQQVGSLADALGITEQPAREQFILALVDARVGAEVEDPLGDDEDFDLDEDDEDDEAFENLTDVEDSEEDLEDGPVTAGLFNPEDFRMETSTLDDTPEHSILNNDSTPVEDQPDNDKTTLNHDGEPNVEQINRNPEAPADGTDDGVAGDQPIEGN